MLNSHVAAPFPLWTRMAGGNTSLSLPQPLPLSFLSFAFPRSHPPPVAGFSLFIFISSRSALALSLPLPLGHPSPSSPPPLFPLFFPAILYHWREAHTSALIRNKWNIKLMEASGRRSTCSLAVLFRPTTTWDFVTVYCMKGPHTLPIAWAKHSLQHNSAFLGLSLSASLALNY